MQKDNGRNEKAEAGAHAGENEANADLLECTRETNELVVFFVYDWDQEHKCREKHP